MIFVRVCGPGGGGKGSTFCPSRTGPWLLPSPPLGLTGSPWRGPRPLPPTGAAPRSALRVLPVFSGEIGSQRRQGRQLRVPQTWRALKTPERPEGPHDPGSNTLPHPPFPSFHVVCHLAAPPDAPAPSAGHNLLGAPPDSPQNLLLPSCGSPRNAIPRTQPLISGATGIQVITTANDPNSHSISSPLRIARAIHHFLPTSRVCPQTPPDTSSVKGPRDPPWTLLARR